MLSNKIKKELKKELLILSDRKSSLIKTIYSGVLEDDMIKLQLYDEDILDLKDWYSNKINILNKKIKQIERLIK